MILCASAIAGVKIPPLLSVYLRNRAIEMASKKNLNTDKSIKTRKKYVDTLEPVVRARYLEKIRLIGGKDPYDMPKREVSDDIRTWPEVSYHNIVNYLVIKRSAYTWEQMDAVKSLDAYNYFVSGWVRDIGCIKHGDLCLMVARVRHSQRMNDTALRPWLIAEKSGQVLSAHCDCMAGLGESCSHVGALLFAIEGNVKLYQSKTVTQEKAYWKLPTAIDKVPYTTVEQIDFTSAKSKKKSLDLSLSNEVPALRSVKVLPPSIPSPSEEELNAAFDQLLSAGHKPALLSLHQKYSQTYIPSSLNPDFPKPLNTLYDKGCSQLSKRELDDVCSDIFDSLTVTKEQVAAVEINTKLQADDKMWSVIRTGRITSSNLKRVCHTKVENPSMSLLMDICYPRKHSIQSDAIMWGRKHERTASSEYIDFMMSHDDFMWELSGLWLSETHPFLGASPDGLVSCTCCGNGCVEIKCPFSKRNMTVSEAIASDPKFYLKEVDGEITLDQAHDYYYQVQCQLFVCQKRYCHFVVWTQKDCRVVRIQPNHTFWTEQLSKAQIFFTKVLLPELVGNYFTRPSAVQTTPDPKRTVLKEINALTQVTGEEEESTSEIICICRNPYNPEDGPVIGCDNENCPYKWLHFKCINLKHVPEGDWICSSCK